MPKNLKSLISLFFEHPRKIKQITNLPFFGSRHFWTLNWKVFLFFKYARMVELVDTLDLKSNDHCGRAGSSPAPGTKQSPQSPDYESFQGFCFLMG